MMFNPQEGINTLERMMQRLSAAGNALGLAWHECEMAREMFDGDDKLAELGKLIVSAERLTDTVMITAEAVGEYIYQRYAE